jgi:hypothetical protein
MEAHIKWMRRQGRRGKQILGEIKENRRYWNLRTQKIIYSGKFALEEAMNL